VRLKGVGESSNNIAEVSLGLLPQSLDGVKDGSLLSTGFLCKDSLELVHSGAEDVLQLGLDKGGELGKAVTSILLELS